ncbi:hypothetical protein F5146DRAFT_1102173 [Armillaria mellea]|nr:hypothetical protein F5146DRAFT_1102173 [Armillaria mellea]
MVQAPTSPDIFGSLDTFPHYDETTPSKATQLSSFLSSDGLIRDPATLISHWGIMFFTDQTITIGQTSYLHIHLISEDIPELGKDVSVILSKGGIAHAGSDKSMRASKGWHVDITFERVPSDYTANTFFIPLLKMYMLLPGLHTLHSGEFFNDVRSLRFLLSELTKNPHGAPDNTGPVIRTNPVTGLKTLFVNQTWLTLDKSDDILAYLSRHILENHDIQVRFRWSKNNVMIWDSWSPFHTAT